MIVILPPCLMSKEKAEAVTAANNAAADAGESFVVVPKGAFYVVEYHDAVGYVGTL